MIGVGGIDAVLPAWLQRHGLFVATEYRDDPVRAVSVVDDAGDTYQIWFVPGEGRVLMRAEYRPRKRADRRTWSAVYSDESLAPGLEDAYEVVVSWIVERGHTRTPA